VGNQTEFGMSPRMFYAVVEQDDRKANGGREAGCYRMRIPDIHHGMETEDLPWFRQMTHSQSHQKLGKSPTRLAKGSCCLVMYNDSGENPLVIGSVDTSGLTKGGKTLDGAPEVDQKYNSLPPACHGSEETDVQHYFVGRQPDSVKHDDPEVLLETPGLSDG